MRKQIVRIVIFLAGLVIMACGIALSTRSGLGISPLNSLAYVCSVLTGAEMGYFTMLLYLVYVLLEIPIKGKSFRAADLLQIPVAVLFGLLVNWARSLTQVIVCSNYLQQILCTLVSIVLIAAGTVIYVIPELVCQAPEGLILSICSRWNLAFSTVKTGFDITIVVLALLVGLAFSGSVIGIREGTLIAAVGVGFMTGIFNKTIRPVLAGVLNKGEKIHASNSHG